MAFQKSKARSVKVEESAAEEIKQAVGKMTTEKVTNDLAAAQRNIQKALGQIAGDVVELFAQRTKLEADIAQKQVSLDGLYGIQASADTLDQLNEEIVKTREAWKLEKDAQTVVRNREEEQFNYLRAKERRTVDDNFATIDTLRQKGWNDREAEITAKEKEITDLRAQVAAHPDILEKAKNEAAGKARGMAEAAAKVDLNNLQIGHAANVQVLGMQVQNLADQLKDSKVALEKMEARLTQALQDNKELASRVTDSANQKELSSALQMALSNNQQGGQKNR